MLFIQTINVTKSTKILRRIIMALYRDTKTGRWLKTVDAEKMDKKYTEKCNTKNYAEIKRLRKDARKKEGSNN